MLCYWSYQTNAYYHLKEQLIKVTYIYFKSLFYYWMPGGGGLPVITTKPFRRTPSTPSSVMTSLTARDVRDIVSEVIRMPLTTNSSLRLEPFSGRDSRELVKWLREFKYRVDENNWDDAAKLRKFPTYLRIYGLLWYN